MSGANGSASHPASPRQSGNGKAFSGRMRGAPQRGPVSRHRRCLRGNHRMDPHRPDRSSLFVFRLPEPGNLRRPDHRKGRSASPIRSAAQIAPSAQPRQVRQGAPVPVGWASGVTAGEMPERLTCLSGQDPDGTPGARVKVLFLQTQAGLNRHSVTCRQVSPGSSVTGGKPGWRGASGQRWASSASPAKGPQGRPEWPGKLPVFSARPS